jgi:hypothetical protein
MKLRSKIKQAGVSLGGLLIILAFIGMGAILALKVTPTVTEYFSIKKAITSLKVTSTTVADIRASFDKQAEVNYVESITGKDLEILKNGEEFEVSFAYQKKIGLVGPVSLLIDYAGSSAKKPTKKLVQ